MMKYQLYESPCGRLIIGADREYLCLCDWNPDIAKYDKSKKISHAFGTLDNEESEARAILDMAASQLNEYFCGKRMNFDIPMKFSGTDFQKKVWNCLLDIRYGETASYKEIALAIGCPSATRTAANAIGANRISIFTPCHRIIGADGRLTGYRGGLTAKKFLLRLEEKGSAGSSSPE